MATELIGSNHFVVDDGNDAVWFVCLVGWLVVFPDWINSGSDVSSIFMYIISFYLPNYPMTCRLLFLSYRGSDKDLCLPKVILLVFRQSAQSWAASGYGRGPSAHRLDHMILTSKLPARDSKRKAGGETAVLSQGTNGRTATGNLSSSPHASWLAVTMTWGKPSSLPKLAMKID